MDFKRSAAVIASIVMLSAVFYVAGIATSSLYGFDDDINGEWYLTYAKKYDSDGNLTEGIEGMQFDLSFSVENGSMKGTLNGTDFVGALFQHILRFQADIPEGSFQAIGKLSTPNDLNICAVLFDGSVSESYTMLFTRDNVLPNMIEFLSLNVTGDWICNDIKGADPGFQEISLNIAEQSTSVCHGTMDRDGTVSKFSAVISMVDNDNMNFGLLLDENGELWLLSTKKGLMVLYSVSASSGAVESSRIDMVRNAGNIYIPVLSDIGGTTWTGTIGYDVDRNGSEIGDYTTEITEQNENLIRGKISSGIVDYEFEGMFISTLPNAAELRIAGSAETFAMMFVDGDSMKIMMFGPETLPGGYLLMEFR
jgi:hypothetical protein